MRNYFILNGADSRDFGVYISGQGTFSAPQKAYTFYNVPGRNGAILGNENRLENINVSYEAFIYADFDNSIAKFRTYLLSLNGYVKLTDSYHPDEYRYAVYTGPFEPKVTKINDAGSFTITFSCKPQRYLVSGDTTYNWINQEVTGSTITLDAAKVDPSVLLWDFEADHTVHLSSRSGGPGNSSYTTSILAANHIKVDYKDQDGVLIPDKGYDDTLVVPVTKAHADLIAGSMTVYSELIQTPTTGWTKTADNTFRVSVSGWNGVLASLRTKVTGANTRPSNYEYVVVDNTTALGSESYACCYSSGYYYVKDIDYATASDYQTAKGGHFVDVALSTAQTVSITPFVPDYQTTGFFTLSGSYSYAYSPYTELFTTAYHYSDSMSNPTEFPSSPLIRAYGNGVFVMDGITITITNATSYTDIDCDLMDCYEGSVNRNNDVAFSTYDFPKLRPGDNTITIPIGSGISALEITPRWWRV